ncbi:MAG TPA: UPF0182 family protein [Candidatus Stackebrandtia faecavium]|nr:UPF0182 family protein [Candidatus Stackebrandtia faecavium]
MATRTSTPWLSRRGKIAIGLVAAAVVLFALGSAFVGLYTRYLWFDSIGYTSVMSTLIWSKVLLFIIFGAVTGLWTAAMLYIAYRFRPDSVPHTPEQQGMERYRSALNPRIGLWIGLVSGFVGIIAGMSAQSNWQQWLLFTNAKDFGRKDPEFGLDVGFYVFKLPFYEYIIGVGFTLVAIGIVAALAGHYIYGAVRMSGRGERITSAARWHLSLLVGGFLVLKAVAYYFDRFALTLENNDVTNLTGGGYTEMTALLPAKEILIFVAVLAAIAVVVFSNSFARSLVIPGMALGLVVVSAIALGGIYPAVVKSVSVTPNAPAKEAKYVQYTMDGTMYAYGMGDLQRENVDLKSASADALQDSAESGTVQHTRLMDPSIVSDTFTQRQQARGFHDFNEKLDVDSYTDKDGNVQDYVVGVRELNPSKFNDSQQDWTVRHTIYTHGYGLVAATANEVCDSGPYFESGSLRELQTGEGEEGDSADASPTSCRSNSDFVDIERPQIYFGELNDDYAIVGVPDGDKPREYDHPAQGTTTEDEGADEVEEDGDAYVTFEGDTGVDVSSMGRKLAYAWEFGELKFLLSEQFNENSQLLYNRTPRERVKQVAPFLTMDSDPYPTVVDGKIKWVMDGYTTSNAFPYSNSLNLQDAASDSYTNAGASQQANEDINYMRNSVKATVDAYTGEVELYQFGDEDPLLDVWNAAFDGVVKPESAIPDDLQQHLRYPVDHFKVQRHLLQRFHVESAEDFINGSKVWQAPNDPTQKDTSLPPYYVVAAYPGQDAEHFQLTSNFAPKRRDNVLASMMTGRYDENNKPILTLYELGGSQVESTGQVHQQMTSSPAVTEDRKSYEQQDLKVQWGNLLSLPVGNNIMYVEPMYVRQETSSGTALPLLRGVLVSYGGKIGYGPYLDSEGNQQDGFVTAVGSVVSQLTGDDDAGDDDAGDDDQGDGQGDGQGEVPQAVQDALDAIDAAMAKLDKAVDDGDLAAQGEALQELDSAMQQYKEAKGAS